MNKNSVHQVVISAMLCAIGIIIPMFSPLRVVLEPASFTLGSHIAIFIAMMVSPGVAAAVSLGTALGFFLGGFPIVVVLRAATHVVFAVAGALWLKKQPGMLGSLPKICLFSFVVASIHGVCEVIVSSEFYFRNAMSEGHYAQGFVMSVLLLVGVGTIIHSMVDFALALIIWKPISKSIKKMLLT